jgi:hypothetical protein
MVAGATMKLCIYWVGYSPVDITEPQHAAILLRAIFDAMERGEPANPLHHFRFELAGIQCIGSVDPYEEVDVEPEPEDYVRVGIYFAAPGCGIRGQPYIVEDGTPGVHFEIGEDDCHEAILDSDEIPWSM